MYLKKISEQEEMVDEHISLSVDSGLGLLPTFSEGAYFVALYIWLMKFIQLSLKVVLDCFLSINSNMCSMHVKTGGTCVYFIVLWCFVLCFLIYGCLFTLYY